MGVTLLWLPPLCYFLFLRAGIPRSNTSAHAQSVTDFLGNMLQKTKEAKMLFESTGMRRCVGACVCGWVLMCMYVCVFLGVSVCV